MNLLQGCDQVRRQLSAFVGGELDVAVADRVREHLRACHGCRLEAGAQLQATRALRRAVCAAFVPGVDEELFVDLHERVLARVADEPPPAAPVPVLAPRRQRLAIAAASLTLFACGWMLARPSGGLIDRSPLRPGSGAAHAASAGGPAMQLLSHDDLLDIDGPGQARAARIDADGAGPGRPGHPARAGTSPADGDRGGATANAGLGLMGRLSLRTLEDEHVVLLPPAGADDVPAVVPAGRTGAEPARTAPLPGKHR